MLIGVTSAGFTAGNAGEIVPCGGPPLLTVVVIMMIMMVMAVVFLMHHRTSRRTAVFPHTGAVVVTVPVSRAAIIAAPAASAAASPTVLTAATGQQQQDNQTIHMLCFLSVFVTISYAANTLMFLIRLSVSAVIYSNTPGACPQDLSFHSRQRSLLLLIRLRLCRIFPVCLSRLRAKHLSPELSFGKPGQREIVTFPMHVYRDIPAALILFPAVNTVQQYADVTVISLPGRPPGLRAVVGQIRAPTGDVIHKAALSLQMKNAVPPAQADKVLHIGIQIAMPL